MIDCDEEKKKKNVIVCVEVENNQILAPSVKVTIENIDAHTLLMT